MRLLSTQEPDAQHRRHADGFADLAQTRPGQDRGFGRGQPGFGQRDLRTAGLNDQHVVFDQFLDQFDMHLVLLDARVGAAHHTGHTADAAVDDVVVERR